MNVTWDHQDHNQVPEEALVTCSRCDGTGKDKRLKENVGISSYGISGYQVCPRCRGTGKTDWVSNITGSNDIEWWSGISGYTGVSGVSGLSGYAGVSGFSGISGSTGVSFYGVSGMVGTTGYSKPPPLQGHVTISPPNPIATFPSVPKPSKRDRLLQKIRDNTVKKINDFLGGLNEGKID